MNLNVAARILLVLCAGLALAPGASAQVFTPALLTPHQQGGVGAVLSGGIGSEDGYAVEGFARRTYGPLDLGVRVGVADFGGAALLVGLEYRNPVSLPATDTLFQLAVTGAAQGILGTRGGPGISAGVTAGRSFLLPGASITPYLHPRLALLERGGGGVMDLALLAELGADFAFASDLAFHVALGFGGETANLGFGVSWR